MGAIMRNGAGNGAAAPQTAPYRSGGVATSFPILQSTFYPNLSQIGPEITEILNGRHYEKMAPEMAPRRRKRRRSVAAALLHPSPSFNLPPLTTTYPPLPPLTTTYPHLPPHY